VEVLVSVLLPILLLAFYLKSSWSTMKHKPVLVGLLVGGTFLYYVGILLTQINPYLESTLKLLGTCLFFTAVAINISNLRQESRHDQNSSQDKDSQ
jgi:hypothetical protein